MKSKKKEKPPRRATHVYFPLFRENVQRSVVFYAIRVFLLLLLVQK